MERSRRFAVRDTSKRANLVAIGIVCSVVAIFSGLLYGFGFRLALEDDQCFALTTHGCREIGGKSLLLYTPVPMPPLTVEGRLPPRVVIWAW
jgi:hypothetical protein